MIFCIRIVKVCLTIVDGALELCTFIFLGTKNI